MGSGDGQQSDTASVIVQDPWIKESIKHEKIEEYYHIGEELGKSNLQMIGASSVVHLGTMLGTNYEFAIKVVSKVQNKALCMAEIGLLLKIRHENIIQLKEVFETDCHIYMVMELAKGGELFDRIVARGCYTERDASECLKQLLEGVKYIHSENILHRDLKPENILYETIEDNSKLKIADFGLATMFNRNVQSQNVCGTPGYCAPEVLLGYKYGPAVDVWSLGVIAYILLAGYEPFYADNETEMFRRILKGDIRFDEPHWDHISLNAKDIILKMLKLDPDKRISAAEALVHPWVIGIAARNDHMEETQIKLKEFNARRKCRSESMNTGSRSSEEIMPVHCVCNLFKKEEQLSISDTKCICSYCPLQLSDCPCPTIQCPPIIIPPMFVLLDPMNSDNESTKNAFESKEKNNEEIKEKVSESNDKQTDDQTDDETEQETELEN